MFQKYSTGKIPPKNSIGKGPQGKKTADTPVADVDVSEESDSEPAIMKTASRRVVKKKVTIFIVDNIIPDPAIALELGKSTSLSEAVEEEAARQVHATYARIVTESEPKPAKKRTGSRTTSDVVIQDTPSALKPKPTTSKLKLKSAQSLTPEEHEAANIMQALKESKKTNRRQPGTRGSNEGTGVSLGVPNESTFVHATSSEGTGTKPGVPDEKKVTSEEKVILEWGSKQESEYLEEDQGDDEEVGWIDSNEDEEKKDDTNDDNSINLEMTDDEETNDEFVHGDEQVNDDEDEEMTNAKVEESGNGDEENTDAAKTDAGKTEEVKDDAKKVELPLTSSSLSVSLGFVDQFLKLSSDTSLVSTIKDTTDAEINYLLDIKIQPEVLHIQSPSVLRVPVSVISEPSVLSPLQEIPLVALVTTLPLPSVSTIPHVPHQTTTPIPIPPITTDAPTITTVVHESDALLVVLQRHTADLIQKYFVKPAPESSKIQKPTIDLEKESEKSASEILKIKKEQVENKKMLKYTIKSTDKASLKENPANHALCHALMKALIKDENTMDKGVVDTVKNHKRQHDDDDDDDDEDPSAGPNQGKKTKRRRTKESESSKKPSTTKETPKGKALSKGSKIGKSASTKEPVEEPIAEVVMDDAFNTAGEDVQPPRTPTPDPEWNKHQVVLDQPEQPWFNQMVSTINDPLTFNDLMATLIDFSNIIELEYNFQEYFNALTDKLDWNNLEGDRYPFDLSKPLPLQGRLGHLTVVVDYFFNNDPEYLKTSDLEKTYTTSITKIKVARYEIVGIEDMVPTLWSAIKHAYDKDAAKGIKHYVKRRNHWYRSQMKKFSKQNVYYTQKILSVQSVSVKKMHGYGYLEEVVVKRADRQL
ncbi:hypothetical protein Tco_0184422 [Tanacetum coccineum]